MSYSLSWFKNYLTDLGVTRNKKEITEAVDETFNKTFVDLLSMNFGKEKLLKQIKGLSSAQKYGNIYVKHGISDENKYNISLVIDSNEITLSNSGAEEQLSIELIFEITFKGNNVQVNRYSYSNDSALTFVALVIIAIIVGFIAAASSVPAAIGSAAAALIIWLGGTIGITNKK